MIQIPKWSNLALLFSVRYIVIAGLAFLFWYVIFKRKLSFSKIQLRFPQNKDYTREIFFSLITSVIFASVPYLLLKEPVRQYTLFYYNIHKYPMWWFVLAFPVMLVLHDTYFYFTHRLIHHKRIFSTVHLLHHKSVNPSPWAAFAFHPLEALVEVGIGVIFIFSLPLTIYHLFFFFLFMMLYNVYGHLGWELYPKGFNKTVVGKWINTSVNHNQHHQYFKGNYGLYFLWWDRWLNTIRNDYDVKFEEVKSRCKESGFLENSNVTVSLLNNVSAVQVSGNLVDKTDTTKLNSTS
jgi:Delta7-sterol 5-desaturase